MFINFAVISFWLGWLVGMSQQNCKGDMSTFHPSFTGGGKPQVPLPEFFQAQSGTRVNHRRSVS